MPEKPQSPIWVYPLLTGETSKLMLNAFFRVDRFTPQNLRHKMLVKLAIGDDVLEFVAVVVVVAIVVAAVLTVIVGVCGVVAGGLIFP